MAGNATPLNVDVWGISGIWQFHRRTELQWVTPVVDTKKQFNKRCFSPHSPPPPIADNINLFVFDTDLLRVLFFSVYAISRMMGTRQLCKLNQENEPSGK